MILIPRDTSYPFDALSHKWVNELKGAYVGAVPEYSYIESTFQKQYCLFPIIRRIEKQIRNHPERWNEVLIVFCAIITDRGLLAEQTRDSFSATKANQNRLVTKIGSHSTPKSLERHMQCAKATINDTNSSLWKEYFRDSKRFNDFRKLLDMFRKDCNSRSETPHKVVEFPDMNAPQYRSKSPLKLPFNENVYPDAVEEWTAKHTIIQFKKGERKAALPYFKRLSVTAKLEPFKESELIFFTQRILNIYCNQDKVISGIQEGKQYDAQIAEIDIPKLKRQADACAEIYAYFRATRLPKNLSDAKEWSETKQNQLEIC